MINTIKRNFEIRINKIAKANVLIQLNKSKDNHQIILIDKFNGLVQAEAEAELLQDNTKKLLIFITLLIGTLFYLVDIKKSYHK